MYKLIIIAISFTVSLFGYEYVEKDYEKMETQEQYLVWIGSGCQTKENYSFKNFNEIEKTQLIDKAIDILKSNPEKHSFEQLFIYYVKTNEISKALYWANKAAEYGSVECMRTIVYAYSNGEGVVKDTEKAIVWMIIAAAKGYKPYIDCIKEMSEKDNEILNEHEKKANEWSKKHPEAFFEKN